MMATDRHRSTSLTNAFTYGRSASSWNVGLRCGPTTWSSYSHAFGSVSGKAQQASTKVTSVELEVSLPALERFPEREDISMRERLCLGASS